MSMHVIPTALPEVLIIEPKVFGDERGFFLESFNRKFFEAATGLKREFVQDNHSRSVCNVLRGLIIKLSTLAQACPRRDRGILRQISKLI